MAFTEPAPTPLALLLLGHGADPDSERGVECPGDLPPASDPDLVARAAAAKAALGNDEMSAALRAVSATAAHRLQRGIWTSPGAGDLNR